MIPDGVTYIKGTALPKEKITSIKLPKTLEKLDYYIFHECPMLGDENGLVIITDVLYAYTGYSKGNAIKGVTEITVPYGVREIADFAFELREEIETVTLPDNVKKIGECAFVGCEHLKRINLDHVTQIEGDPFFGCTELADTNTNVKEEV